MGEGDVYAFIIELPIHTTLSGQQVGCSEVLGQTVILISELSGVPLQPLNLRSVGVCFCRFYVTVALGLQAAAFS